jgi:hypothetical protein
MCDHSLTTKQQQQQQQQSLNLQSGGGIELQKMSKIISFTFRVTRRIFESISQNALKPNPFFVEINTSHIPWKDAEQKFWLLLQFSKKLPKVNNLCHPVHFVWLPTTQSQIVDGTEVVF